MAKGKKNELKTENTVEQKAASLEGTKENKPAADKVTKGSGQPARNQSKPRSPLGDNSSMLIQGGNESDAANPDVPTLKKDIPNEVRSETCQSKEQRPEMPSHSYGTSQQTAEQPEQKGSTTHTASAKSAADGNVSAPRPRSKAARKPRTKKPENKAPQNRKVTDYYPIRRSNRKTKAELKNEEHKHIDDVIKKGIEEGMQVKHIEGKGRGVFAVRGFKKGEFVVEYHGDLLELTEAKAREAEYAQDPLTGCYMYYFQYHTKTYCVDATRESERLGRLINHSKNGNCQTKLHPIDGTPHLILVASRDIEAEEELLYDYGDRSKASISAHPWLKY